MKKAKFEGKLSLRKETVARLNDSQMNDVKGGSVTLLVTHRCPVVVLPTRTIPPCTITTNTFNQTVINPDEVIFH
jgi:natural product precursor